MPAFGFASSADSTATSRDELGIWRPLPGGPRPGVIPRDLEPESAAGARSEEAEAVSTWRIALPHDRKQASATLAAAQQRLGAAEAALPLAAARLDGFVRAGGPAPALPPDLAGPEVALFDRVATARERRDPAQEAGALDQVTAFFDKLRDALHSYAAIDTELGGVQIGRTLVSWSGDFRTAWLRGLALDDAQQHTAAVSLALRSRDAWLRLGMTVAAGAAQLTALFSLNPVLALPAAYRFVTQIIQQVQALGQLPAPGPQTHQEAIL